MFRGALRKLGLHEKKLVAWAMYDWADSAFATTIMATMLPIYFADVAASGLESHVRTAYWGYTSAISLAIVAVLSPVLGAMADYTGSLKKFIGLFSCIGIVATAGLYFVEEGDWVLCSVLYIFGNVGFFGSLVFYDGLLPHVSKSEDMDRVSTAGYALGYIGGGVLLAVNLAWVLKPEWFGFANKSMAVRASFLSVSVWWLLFSVPLFLYVKEPKNPHLKNKKIFRETFSRLSETVRSIRQYKQLLVFLLAFWVYMDGVGTIMKMATIYGREVGIEQTHLIGALLLVQFVGIPFTFAFGALAEKIGAKKSIIVTLVVYMLVCCMAYFMTTALHFWMLAFGVAMVQGGVQALSRSVYASIIPVNRSAEFFGFFSISSKFAGVFGPFLFGVVAQVFAGGRFSILFLVTFFIVGIVLLTKFDLEEARRAAGRIK